MSTSDGSVIGTTQIVDHGPASLRYNLVLISEGYQAGEMSKFHNDAQDFVDHLFATVPFDAVGCAINVFRVDVSSTDSGADDPTACGGTGATKATYFDATFCGDGVIQRLLTVDSGSVINVVNVQVPQHHRILVIVNSSTYGGSGGSVGVTSVGGDWLDVGMHEMGHAVFGLADEYEYWSGCGESGHDTFSGPEPSEPNVTANSNRATIKWASLIAGATPMPTTSNADCTQCDSQASPVAAGTVGAFEGARYFHCACFRPAYDCMMRNLSGFCGVCIKRIQDTMAPFMPAPVSLTWPNPADIVYGTPLGPVQLDATAPVAGTFAYTPPAGTCLPAGVYSLSVDFTPNDVANYCSAKATAQINVQKATPTINWTNPSDIDHGTPLGPVQLNATASWVVCGVPLAVPGTFVYNPPAGTVLGVGTQTLCVTFTPNDSANYNVANACVLINILTGNPIVMSVTFSPTDLQQGDRVAVGVTVKNDSVKPHPTQGPDPGFEYSEGDTFQTKGFPSIAGAYRIGVDLAASPYKVADLYRWGFGHTLAPGEVVLVNGYVRFHNSRENGQYYVDMIEEVNQVVQAHQGTTGITVERP